MEAATRYVVFVAPWMEVVKHKSFLYTGTLVCLYL